MRKLQVSAGANRFMDGDVVSVSGEVLLDGLEPEGVDEHVKQASCKDGEKGGSQLASLFDAGGRFDLRVATLGMKAVFGGVVEGMN